MQRERAAVCPARHKKKKQQQGSRKEEGRHKSRAQAAWCSVHGYKAAGGGVSSFPSCHMAGRVEREESPCKTSGLPTPPPVSLLLSWVGGVCQSCLPRPPPPDSTSQTACHRHACAVFLWRGMQGMQKVHDKMERRWLEREKVLIYMSQSLICDIYIRYIF